VFAIRMYIAACDVAVTDELLSSAKGVSLLSFSRMIIGGSVKERACLMSVDVLCHLPTGFHTICLIVPFRHSPLSSAGSSESVVFSFLCSL